MADITLRDLIPAEQLDAEVRALVESLLDIPVEFSFGGGVIRGQVVERKTAVCPECGERFATLSGLAGHRFHKHGVRVKGGKPVKADAAKGR